MTDQPEVTAKQQLDLIWDYIKGFHAVHLIAIGTELGLFEAISEADDGVKSDKLSQRLRLHGPYVDIWCKTACAYALIDIDEEGHLRLAAHMDQLLADKQSPRYIADYAIAATGFFLRTICVVIQNFLNPERSSHSSSMARIFLPKLVP